MLRDIKFRGKREDNLSPDWFEGSLKQNPDGRRFITYFLKGEKTDFTCEVIPESVGMCTGMEDFRNKRDVYEGDIYFTEEDRDEGDARIFYVCTWIEERAAFTWLSKGEYEIYENNGFSAIERDWEGFYVEMNQKDISNMHFYGTIYEHKNKLEDEL